MDGLNSICKVVSKGVVICLLLLWSVGCKGAPLRIPGTEVRPDETVIGPVEGSTSGFMLLQFIPIAQNSRFQRAYAKAMEQAPGATRIADVEIQENWYWAWIMNIYNFHLRGTAVRGK